MDLRETHYSTGGRHPWELARARALLAIARAYEIFSSKSNVLDLGCGDGFIIDELCTEFGARIDAVDINLTADQVLAFAGVRQRVTFHNDYANLPENDYDVITMFDVLEHVADDVSFLRDILARFSQSGAVLFCTVPAFQSLFSAHDHFLDHHRRYSRRRLLEVFDKAGLSVMASGYLFSSLLPVRAGAMLAEKIFGLRESKPGVGQWQHGLRITAALAKVLDFDNCVLFWLAKRGIMVPGLTVWAVCKKLR